MSLTSFLTQDPMQYVPSTSQTSSQLPSWYNDYTQNILNSAASYAAQGPPIYPGPQVAPLTQNQNTGFNTIAGLQGSGTGIAGQGVNAVNNALGQPNASQAAQPYLNAASAPISSQIGQFMNPYLQSVVGANNFLTNRAFNEQVLPGIQNQFTQAGQVYGGSGQGVQAEHMARDLNLNEQLANASTLAGGFNTALGGAAQQAGIYSGLGSTAGGLANAAQTTGIGGGEALGGLGGTYQGLGLQQASAQIGAGNQQQAQTQQNYNTGLQNYLTQFNWPMTGASAMQGALSGIQVPSGSTNYGYSPYGFGMSPLAQGASTYGALNSMFGNGGSLTGTPTYNINLGGMNSPALYQSPQNIAAGLPSAKGGHMTQQRAVLHLRRRLPSAYQQYRAGRAA
jgi:hypothetical protein